MLTYVIADIHGRLDLFLKALRIIQERSPEGGTLVTLGDYVDRGPQSKGVITTLMNFSWKGWKLVALKGNHESMLVDDWKGNYGPISIRIDENDDEIGPTYRSFGLTHPYKVHLIDKKYIDFIDNLPMIHEDNYRVYVHAWIDSERSISEQRENDVLWNRYGPKEEGGYRGKHVVHGHTPNTGPEMKSHRTNLDTGAFFSGILTVGVFDDATVGGPIELIKVNFNDRNVV